VRAATASCRIAYPKSSAAVIASANASISAAIDSQIGVSGVDATLGAGRRATAAFTRTTRLRCVGAGERRGTLLAREIGTTLLFISSSAQPHRDGWSKAFTKLH